MYLELTNTKTNKTQHSTINKKPYLKKQQQHHSKTSDKKKYIEKLYGHFYVKFLQCRFYLWHHDAE